jgi:hypothetical protein
MPRSKTCLTDANVWLALAAERHQHHAAARDWFLALGEEQAAFCRVTQMSFLRLLTNRTVMGEDVVPAGGLGRLSATAPTPARYFRQRALGNRAGLDGSDEVRPWGGLDRCLSGRVRQWSRLYRFPAAEAGVAVSFCSAAPRASPGGPSYQASRLAILTRNKGFSRSAGSIS